MSSGDFKVYQSSLFGRKAKRLKKREKDVLDSQVKRILQDPDIGEEKKGDLQGVRVHKFQMNKKLMLLAYSISRRDISLITFGSHENYYRDIKRYLK